MFRKWKNCIYVFILSIEYLRIVANIINEWTACAGKIINAMVVPNTIA